MSANDRPSVLALVRTIVPDPCREFLEIDARGDVNSRVRYGRLDPETGLVALAQIADLEFPLAADPTKWVPPGFESFASDAAYLSERWMLVGFERWARAQSRSALCETHVPFVRETEYGAEPYIGHGHSYGAVSRSWLHTALEELDRAGKVRFGARHGTVYLGRFVSDEGLRVVDRSQPGEATLDHADRRAASLGAILAVAHRADVGRLAAHALYL